MSDYYDKSISYSCIYNIYSYKYDDNISHGIGILYNNYEYLKKTFFSVFF